MTNQITYQEILEAMQGLRKQTGRPVRFQWVMSEDTGRWLINKETDAQQKEAANFRAALPKPFNATPPPPLLSVFGKLPTAIYGFPIRYDNSLGFKQVTTEPL